MPDARFAKFVVFVNALVPLALLLWDTYWQQLGVNPDEFAIRTTGMLALIFLLLSLAVTPLRRITGQNFFSNFRRMLGLFAFFYGCLHLSIYFVFDRSMDFSSLANDVFQRPFIFLGMIALLAMLPLAITSTTKMIKRLGAVRWKRLHRLAYIAGIAAVVHYYMLVKADIRLPVSFAALLAFLLLFRVVYFASQSARARPTASAGR